MLTQPSETASACGTLTTASTCLTTSVGSLLGGATPQVTAAQTLAQTLMAAVTGLCSVSDAGKCLQAYILRSWYMLFLEAGGSTCVQLFV